MACLVTKSDKAQQWLAKRPKADTTWSSFLPIKAWLRALEMSSVDGKCHGDRQLKPRGDDPGDRGVCRQARSIIGCTLIGEWTAGASTNGHQRKVSYCRYFTSRCFDDFGREPRLWCVVGGDWLRAAPTLWRSKLANGASSIPARRRGRGGVRDADE
jgi:hypothetical protein